MLIGNTILGGAIGSTPTKPSKADFLFLFFFIILFLQQRAQRANFIRKNKSFTRVLITIQTKTEKKQRTAKTKPRHNNKRNRETTTTPTSKEHSSNNKEKKQRTNLEVKTGIDKGSHNPTGKITTIMKQI